MEPWLQSDESHERKRAAQTTFLLLQHTVDYVTLTVRAPGHCGVEGRGSREGRSEDTPQGAPASLPDLRSPPSLAVTIR